MKVFSTKSARVISMGRDDTPSEIKDSLDRDIFIPLADKHGIIEASLDEMSGPEIMDISERISNGEAPGKILDTILVAAGRGDDVNDSDTDGIYR